MKAIKNLFISILLAGLVFQACNDDDFVGDNFYDGESFIRFFLVLDSDGNPLEGGNSDYSNLTVDNYTHKLVKSAKIPVALTPGKEITETITANFTTTKFGDFKAFSIEPQNQLSFGPGKLIDTITVNISERWDTSKVNGVLFELTEVSAREIKIGALNDYKINDKLILNFGKLETTYTFASNRKEIEGTAGETFDFQIDFPKGFFITELAEEELFVQNNDFNYSLTRHPVSKGDKNLSYTFTLLESINKDDVYYESTLNLRDDLGYTPIGNTIFQIVKPIKVERDPTANPAGNFYNLNDPYYRTYMEMWRYDEADGVSEWQASNQFTYPVVVDAYDPNGVLYSDGGTSDPSDDIYHHAFRIGFRATLANRTTNSFNLKRLLNNENISLEMSPGFNVDPALEFYPKDGTSLTEGTVLVISQFLTISNKEGKPYTIGIKGNGTYHKVSDDLWEIVLTVTFSNDELWGGTQEVQYHMYNTNSYQEPDLLDIVGVSPVDL